MLAVPGGAAAGLLGPWVAVAPPPAVPVSVVTLVLDAPDLDAAPRGTGVLVAPDADVVAKGLTHATAKWAWLAASVPGRHVVRLSYGRGGARPSRSSLTALTDASAALGVPLTRRHLVGWARSDWPTGLGAPAPGHRDRVVALRRDLPGGLWVTGAWVAGTGLAAVVADARATAAAVAACRPPQRHRDRQPRRHRDRRPRRRRRRIPTAQGTRIETRRRVRKAEHSDNSSSSSQESAQEWTDPARPVT